MNIIIAYNSAYSLNTNLENGNYTDQEAIVNGWNTVDPSDPNQNDPGIWPACGYFNSIIKADIQSWYVTDPSKQEETVDNLWNAIEQARPDFAAIANNQSTIDSYASIKVDDPTTFWPRLAEESNAVYQLMCQFSLPEE
jgi:hypothetical protein